MSDRELLEAAARAAGIELAWYEVSEGDADCDAGWYCDIAGTRRGWNPLTDDGDALRLAVKLNIQVTPGTYMDHKATAYSQGGTEAYEYVHSQQDMATATRRAIVRAAAALGADK